jgi:hypothetical protein
MQACEYSSSVDSAGAPTAVVTPPGDTATWPGGAVGVVDVSEVGAADVRFGDGDADEFDWLPVPDEHAAIASVAATAVQRGYQRMPPIYARLSAVTEPTGFECCRG